LISSSSFESHVEQLDTEDLQRLLLAAKHISSPDLHDRFIRQLAECQSANSNLIQEILGSYRNLGVNNISNLISVAIAKNVDVKTLIEVADKVIALNEGASKVEQTVQYGHLLRLLVNHPNLRKDQYTKLKSIIATKLDEVSTGKIDMYLERAQEKSLSPEDVASLLDAPSASCDLFMILYNRLLDRDFEQPWYNYLFSIFDRNLVPSLRRAILDSKLGYMIARVPSASSADLEHGAELLKEKPIPTVRSELSFYFNNTHSDSKLLLNMFTYWNSKLEIPASSITELVKNPNATMNLLHQIAKSLPESSRIQEYVVNKIERNSHKYYTSIKQYLLTPKQIQDLKEKFATLPNRPKISWGLINKVLDVPQQPKIVQQELLKLKSTTGTVDYDNLKSTITQLAEGDDTYEERHSYYDGIQTMHPHKSTLVLQLNATLDFRAKLKRELPLDEYRFVLAYISAITTQMANHPQTEDKTLAWLRSTTCAENLEGTLHTFVIVEELQSDILSTENQNQIGIEVLSDSLENLKSLTLAERKHAFKVLSKLMGMWEVSALSSLKKYARSISVEELFLVPAHIKAITAERKQYFTSQSDPALNQTYDKLPSLVGFTKVPIASVSYPKLKQTLETYKANYVWHCKVNDLRVASKRVALSQSMRLLKLAIDH
jgi:hypothetical protein